MLETGKKILNAGEAAAWAQNVRDQGKKVVFTNGCFDLLHAGHVRCLQEARSLGDVLVVGLNSDASVRTLGKGGDRPLVPQDQRAEVLSALAAVDMVVVFDDPTPAALIQQIKPDVLVKGGDWPIESIVGADFVQAQGGRVVNIPLVKGLSTTELIRRIRS